jgi:hypothetical protein
LIDFDFIISDTKFRINFSLFSCIFGKFQHLNPQENQLKLSISKESFDCFHSFFDIMKGDSFCFENIDFSGLKRLIDYLEINSLFQAISPKIPLSQILDESLQFISQSFSDYLGMQYNQSLMIIVQNISKVSFEELNKLLNSHL